jgi:glycerol uptake facilitator protein
LLLLAILGIVDSKSPTQLAGIVIGGAVVGIILIFGPITGASLNPARAFGPELVQAIAGGTTFWTQYLPVYLIPGLLGAAAAAFAYDYLANPRLVERPIKEAVVREEVAAAGAH